MAVTTAQGRRRRGGGSARTMPVTGATLGIVEIVTRGGSAGSSGSDIARTLVAVAKARSAATTIERVSLHPRNLRDVHVIITGSSGLIGSALSAHLAAAGHQVTKLVRRDPGSGEAHWDPVAGLLDPSVLASADAVVHLAGAGIGDRRWTDAYKREILESRTRTTELLARTIAGLEGSKPALLSGSAIGIYGPRGDEELDETSTLGSGFLADVCREWEARAEPAAAAGARVVLLRTGIVLSPKGGALRKQLPLFRAGLGGKMGKGNAWQSWISLDDEVRAIEHLLAHSEISGPVNLTAPQPVTNAEFTKVLAAVLKRPSFMTVPAFGPNLLLGGELAEALLFTGQRVRPAVLLQSGFEFSHPTLDGALRSLLGRP
jgi:uncharacterized protein (TIGR01777 family)